MYDFFILNLFSGLVKSRRLEKENPVTRTRLGANARNFFLNKCVFL